MEDLIRLIDNRSVTGLGTKEEHYREAVFLRNKDGQKFGNLQKKNCAYKLWSNIRIIFCKVKL